MEVGGIVGDAERSEVNPVVALWYKDLRPIVTKLRPVLGAVLQWSVSDLLPVPL